MSMDLLDVTGFDPPHKAEDGTLTMRVHTHQQGLVLLVVDSVLVDDLALALVKLAVRK